MSICNGKVGWQERIAVAQERVPVEVDGHNLANY